MIQFDRINLADFVVVVALSTALFIAIRYGMNELYMSIASGLLGYIGGAGKGIISRHKEDESK